MESKVTKRLLRKTIKDLEACKFNHPLVHEACQHLGFLPSQLLESAPMSPAKKEVEEVRRKHFEQKQAGRIQKVAMYMIARNLAQPETVPFKETERNLDLLSPAQLEERRHQLKLEREAKTHRVRANLEALKKQQSRRVHSIQKRLSQEKPASVDFAEELKQKAYERDEKIRRIRERLQFEVSQREREELRKQGTPEKTLPSMPSVHSTARPMFRHKGETLHSDDLEEKLKNIEDKLKHSEERHLEYITRRGLPRTTRHRSSTQRKPAEDPELVVVQVQRLQHSLERSRKQREEHMYKELERVARHLQDWSDRRQHESIAEARNQHQRERLLRSKELKIEKVRAHLKDMQQTKSLVIAEKNKLKQQDAQEALLRNQQLFEAKRQVLLDKIHAA